MKNIVKTSMILMVAGSLLMGTDMYKKYDISSAKIDYKITGSSDIMGMVTKTVGKKRVVFSNFGAKELVEENKVDKEVIGGKSTINKSHTLTLMDKSIIYNVDFNKKRTMRMQNHAIVMMGLSKTNTVQQVGKKMMLQMGGKKIGTDKILGYKCDIWAMMGTKQCIHKGVILRVETDMMGIKGSEVATNIEFDISKDTNKFKLPNFPIYDMQGNKIDKSNISSMDSSDEMKAMKSNEDMAAIGAAMATARQNAGIKEGEEPTSAQTQDMIKAMQQSMFPRMKEQFLAQEEILIFGKKCLSKANNLKEANICNQKTNAMGEEQEEDFDEWNPTIKKEILGFIDEGLEMMKCMKDAKDSDDIQKCMPKE